MPSFRAICLFESPRATWFRTLTSRLERAIAASCAWQYCVPECITKIVLSVLIGIIPNVGWLQLLGWMLAALDNLRHGWQVLPPAGFRYATRGINLFAASLIWGLAVAVLIYGSM